MAIIRKGDKKAEENLKKAAAKQTQVRKTASDNEKEKAGLVNARSIRIDPKTKKAYTLDLGNPVTGNAYDIVRKPFSGPISGSAVAKSNRSKTKGKLRAGSGVVQGGKVIKGGEIAKNVAKGQAKKKKGK